MSNIENYNQYRRDAHSLAESNIEYIGLIGRERSFPSRILVIGAGGTSSWFAPKFSKIINDAIRKNLLSNKKLEITYLDGDVV